MNAHWFKGAYFQNLRRKNFLRITLAMVASLLLLSPPVPLMATEGTVIANSSELEWEPWQGFPEGAEIAVLRGDQNSIWDEAFVRIPAGFQVPHHNHTARELVLWIEGKFTFVADDGTKQELGPTAYLNLAPGNKHSVRCGDESPCLLYLKYDRPYDVNTYPHPAGHSAHAH